MVPITIIYMVTTPQKTFRHTVRTQSSNVAETIRAETAILIAEYEHSEYELHVSCIGACAGHIAWVS